MDRNVTRPYPDLTGCRHAAQRAKVDPPALDLVRALEDAYYGTATAWDREGTATARAADGWRHGASHPVTIGGRAYDIEISPSASQAVFDRLHGLIWLAHAASLTLQKQADGVVPDEGEADELAVSKQAVRNAAAAGDDVRAAVPALLRAAFDA